MEKLRKNSLFQDVYRNHRSFADKFFVMYIRPNGLEVNRVGFSVSKKVGNSVVRHHVTRLLREAFRLSEEMFNSGLDIVIIARPASAEVTFEETKRSLTGLAKRHRFLKSTV
ncbi:MAG: ribonuclease P protein component [Lachnospiraceae bacterium]|nr:ribonuclease P protein component [Lachnospiraceae bacterium]MCR5476071.1 ribonuclease P protein component [Lachnospiraceae bacterium]